MVLKRLSIPSFVSIFLLVLFYLLLSGVFMFTFMQAGDHDYTYYLGILAVCIYILVVFNINSQYFKSVGLSPPKLISFNGIFFKQFGIGLLLMFIFLYSTRIIKSLETKNIDYVLAVLTLGEFAKALYASVTEEIVFRGTLLRFFNLKNKRYTGLLISSLIFGVLHLSNVIVGLEISFIYVLKITIFGLLFGLIYLNFGLVASISCHFANNLFVGSFVKSTGYGNYNYALVLALCIFLFIRDRRKQLRLETSAVEN